MAAQPMSVEALAQRINEAVERHKAGDLDGAEATYRALLADHPNEPHTLHFLGVIQHQRGDAEAAARFIGKAIEINPGAADFHSNLGAARFALNDMSGAEESFRKSIELGAQNGETFANLAVIEAESGRLGDAIDHYRRALELAPDTPKNLRRLADACIKEKYYLEALKALGRLVELRPDDADIHNAIGYAYEMVDEPDKAVASFERAIELSPDAPEFIANLGTAFKQLGRYEEAEQAFARAAEASVGDWHNLAHLAATYVKMEDYDRAYAIYERLVKERPEDAGLHNDYGVAFSLEGRPAEAEKRFREAIRLKPEYPEALNNLAGALIEQGHLEDGIAAYKEALNYDRTYLAPLQNLQSNLSHEKRYDEAYIYAKIFVDHEQFNPSLAANPFKVFRTVCDFNALAALGNPWEVIRQCRDKDATSTFLMALAITSTEDEIAEMAAAHRKWGDNVLRTASRFRLPPAPPRTPRDKLRIGLMSADLRAHSVAKFVRPLLKNYDRDRFEFYCYSPRNHVGDRVQERFVEMVDAFRFVEGMPIREIARVIRDDEVDILFDLQGFTADTKVRVFAYRPAPVQVSWLGYPFTTGISEVDYILLDQNTRPLNDDWLVETPLVMDKSWVCFGEFDPVSITDEPPMLRNGQVTFGTLNNPYKFTLEMMELWAEIVKRVPGSRFLVVRPECRSMVFCRNFTEQMESFGVSREQIHLVNNHPVRFSHLEFYNEIDVSLDTFPVTGGTTTCDAMWMGVPVVARVGPSFHQRVGYSLMRSGGMEDLCAATPEQYVEMAVELAENPDLLRQVRLSQRQALLDSPLCDAKGFTDNFERLMTRVAKEKGLI